jgi:hypothetical protein
MDSTIIIEDIILVVLRFDAYGYVFYTLLKGKLRMASRSYWTQLEPVKFYNLADGLKLFLKKNLNQIQNKFCFILDQQLP